MLWNDELFDPAFALALDIGAIIDISIATIITVIDNFLTDIPPLIIRFIHANIIASFLLLA